MYAFSLGVLSACSGGGGGDDDSPPPAVNQAPVLAAIGAKTVDETQPLNFTVTATDAESTPTLSASDLPAGATFNGSTGVFNWATATGDATGSPYSVTFTATDSGGLTDTETVAITVTPAVTADCTVGITAPEVAQLQTSADLLVTATLSCSPETPAGWGVKLVVTGANNGGGGEVTVTSEPFSNTFAGLAKDEYAVIATVVNASGADVSGAQTRAEVTPAGIGDYYVAIGDSITFGIGDFDGGDDTSNDGRNSSRGYPPILNDQLTAALGYPHTVINAGVEGDTSAGGLSALPSVLSNNPDAQRVLVKYGMNDARQGMLLVPSGLGLNPGDSGYPGTFKDNMQQIIDAINADGKEAVLAKVNIALADTADSTNPYPDPDNGARSLSIKEFNQVIDELRAISANNINITPPDFYTFFLNNFATQYSDNIHPNGVGYQSMADLWTQAINP